MSMKNSNDTIGNRTHNLPACSAVPQPIAPPLAPHSPYQLTYPLNKIQFMTNIKRLLFQHQDAPSSGSFQEQWNTNQTCQSRYWSPSLVSLKYLMMPVRMISTWFGTCIVLFSYTPWGWHLSAKTCRSLIHATNCILWHVFDWVHSLVDMVNVTICVVWVPYSMFLSFPPKLP